MNLGDLFEDDLLDLIFTNCAETYGMQGSFPLRDVRPSVWDAIMGTLFIMIPITPAAYYFWQWMGWL